MKKIYFCGIVQFFIYLSCFSQNHLKINLERSIDTNLSTIPHSFSIPRGNWKNVYKKPNLENSKFDSIFFLSSNIDYFQTIYQAYKKGDMSQDFLENQISKWGLDTLKLSPKYIRSYMSALIAYKKGQPVLIIDKNNNGVFSDDKVFPKSTGKGIHTLLFDRFQNGKILKDSVNILVNNIDFRDKQINFKFIEKRHGDISINNKRYNLNLEALLNDYKFDEFSKIKISHKNEIFGEFSLNDLIEFNKNEIYQITSISEDGGIIELKRYRSKKLYSLQVGNYIPPFKGRNIKGNDFNIEDFKRNYTLVYFWNSSCAASTNALNKSVNKLIKTNINLKLVSIALDESTNIADSLKHDENTNVLIVEPANGPINQIFKVKSYPAYYLINPDGKILLKSDLGINTLTFNKEISKVIITDQKSVLSN